MTEQSILALDEIRRAVCGEIEGGLWRELKLAEEIAKLRREIADAKGMARSLGCTFPDTLHLADIIEKYVWRDASLGGRA